jgi:hypothetical protein
LFPYNTARKRIKHHTKLDHNSIPISCQSPLHDAEDDIINFLVALSKIGSPVSCGEAVYLINDLINNTIHQDCLIAWKHKQGIKQLPDEIGRIGSKYWYSFLERNKQKIETKKGRKFELDRSNWTKYRYFKSMYEDIEKELVDAKVAVRLDEPVWMDANGNSVAEVDLVGMKVCTKFTHPNMCITMDEVGCNLNMTKDGHVNGKNLWLVKEMRQGKKQAKRKSTLPV